MIYLIRDGNADRLKYSLQKAIFGRKYSELLRRASTNTNFAQVKKGKNVALMRKGY